MPERAWPHPPKQDNYFTTFKELDLHAKIEILAQLVYEILKNYYFGTLWACLGISSQLPTQNENFPKCGIYARKQVSIRLFNLYHFQKKIMNFPKLEFSQTYKLQRQ